MWPCESRTPSYVWLRNARLSTGNRTVRRLLSPRVQGELSLRQNRNHVHIVQTKVGVLSPPHAKVRIPLGFPVSPSRYATWRGHGSRD